MRKGLLIFFGITAIFAILSSFLGGSSATVSRKNTTIIFKNNVVVKADVSDTDFLRQKGLSGRASLLEGTGMWFVYPKSGIYSFWMPDMHFSIDILWFDEKFQAVHIKENATPESYPDVFTPDTPAQYVLEVPVGFVRKNGIILGDKVSVQKEG